RRFEGTAHAVECFSGDELRVWVRQAAGAAVDITSAWWDVCLVDRTTQRESWALVFAAFNFGVTWDGSFWWTTDHRDNVNPALFRRSPSGLILTSYQGFDFIQSGVSGARRNRAIVFASDGFIYGVGNDHRQVAKIDP